MGEPWGFRVWVRFQGLGAGFGVSLGRSFSGLSFWIRISGLGCMVLGFRDSIFGDA